MNEGSNMRSKTLVSLITLFITFIFLYACGELERIGPDPCSDGIISASDAVWTHGDGDLQNTKRAPGARVNGCITGPITKPTLQWSFELGGPGTAAAPVVGDDGTIYIVGEYPGEPIGGGVRNSGLFAINPNGTMKWFFSIPLDIGNAQGVLWNESPALGRDGTIYLASWDSTLYAFSPGGTVKWKHQFRRGRAFRPATPAIDVNGNIYTGTDTVFCFRPDGSIKWTYVPEDTVGGCTKISLSHSRIFCGFYYPAGLVALDYEARKIWYSSIDFSDFFNNGILVDEDENIYFKGNGNLYSLDRNGQQRWAGSSGTVGGLTQPVLRGDNLYFGVVFSFIQVDKNTGIKQKDLVNVSPAYASETTMPIVDDAGNMFCATANNFIAATDNTGKVLWYLQDMEPDFMPNEGYMAMTYDGGLVFATWSIDRPGKRKLYCLK